MSDESPAGPAGVTKKPRRPPFCQDRCGHKKSCEHRVRQRRAPAATVGGGTAGGQQHCRAGLGNQRRHRPVGHRAGGVEAPLHVLEARAAAGARLLDVVVDELGVHRLRKRAHAVEHLNLEACRVSAAVVLEAVVVRLDDQPIAQPGPEHVAHLVADVVREGQRTLAAAERLVAWDHLVRRCQEVAGRVAARAAALILQRQGLASAGCAGGRRPGRA